MVIGELKLVHGLYLVREQTPELKYYNITVNR